MRVTESRARWNQGYGFLTTLVNPSFHANVMMKTSDWSDLAEQFQILHRMMGCTRMKLTHKLQHVQILSFASTGSHFKDSTFIA